ncbi:MAG: glutathione S-transferase family protein [Sphingomicrobium sp.]
MLTVHHLNDSRSQRILWLLEELQVPYDIKFYQRDPHTKMAPAELQQIHPLGRSPVTTDDGRAIAESGAIIDYIIRHHGDGRLQPDPRSREYDDYVYWLHYAEGSASLPFVIDPIAKGFGRMATPLQRRVDHELDLNLKFIDNCLAKNDYLLGSELTAADVQMSFVGELAVTFRDASSYANLDAWVARFQARPAYQAALERGGTYRFVRKPAA